MSYFNITFLIFCLVATSCARQNLTVTTSSPPAPSLPTPSLPTPSLPTPSLPLQIVINPGDVKSISIPLPESNTKPLLTCNNDSIPFFIKDNHLNAFLVESYFSKQKSYDCYIGDQKVVSMKIIPKKYPSELLRVDKKKLVLSPKDLKRYLREKNILNRIYRESPKDKALFDGPFQRPLNSKITSYYGVKRVYNNKKKSQHLGVDFRAKVGIPIPASNQGKVVFTGDLFFTGNTVIIDHGLNIFTVYAHLSKINAKDGERVDKGKIIGYSGMTGRITGPHLHWGVKIQNHWVNGLSLTQLD